MGGCKIGLWGIKKAHKGSERLAEAQYVNKNKNKNCLHLEICISPHFVICICLIWFLCRAIRATVAANL